MNTDNWQWWHWMVFCGLAGAFVDILVRMVISHLDDRDARKNAKR